MENTTLNLAPFIFDSLNSIFFKIFSSIDATIYSSLDSILFINPDIINNSKFQQFLGTDSTNGLLLIANALIFGVALFYILKFSISHLTYAKIDSPYQFIFKCIIFAACMNSSLWICEKIIELVSLLSDSILKIGNLVTGNEINFSNLVNTINSSLFPAVESFDILSFDGFLKLANTICVIYILLAYSVRYIMCKILILLSPFAFVSLINNCFDGFFKSWLKDFLVILFMQVFVSIVLVLGFCLNFYFDDTISKLTYFAILFIIANCKFNVKELLAHIYDHSQNTLKDLV